MEIALMELHDLHGHIQLCNLDSIEFIRNGYDDTGQKVGTMITLKSGISVGVRETVDEIYGSLKDMQKPKGWIEGPLGELTPPTPSRSSRATTPAPAAAASGPTATPPAADEQARDSERSTPHDGPTGSAGQSLPPTDPS